MANMESEITSRGFAIREADWWQRCRRRQRGELSWTWLRSANSALAIDAQTIACEWDGSTADYGLIVDHRVAIDQLR
jgi:hypothetical protein